MKRKFVGVAVYGRHGKSEYTNIFPDLTDEGKRDIRNAAWRIRAFLSHYSKGKRPVKVHCSPAVRAKGSASIVSEVLEISLPPIETPLLGPARLEDENKARALFLEYSSRGGMKELCTEYARDRRFEDGEVIEPRSCVGRRFCEHLDETIKSLVVSGAQDLLVFISHFEVLLPLASFFHQNLSEPLRCGEFIYICFYRRGNDGITELDAIFRDESLTIFFDHEKKILV